MNKSSDSLQKSDSDSDFLNADSAQRRILSNHHFLTFSQSMNRVGLFIKGLEENGETPIPDYIFEFCGKYKDFQMPSKNVLNLLEKRVQRMTKNKKRKKNWNEEDTRMLVWMVSKFMWNAGIQQIQSLNLQNWKTISSLIPGSYPESCMFKILSLKQNKLSKNKWTSQQSQVLSSLVEQIVRYFRKNKKKDWKKIAQDLYLSPHIEQKIFRSAKQCKQHWTSFLNPQLKKGSWDISEDKILFQYVLTHDGFKRWANLSKIIKGRTENALKNRFNIIIDRERVKTGLLDEKQLVLSYLESLKGEMNFLNEVKIQEKDQRQINEYFEGNSIKLNVERGLNQQHMKDELFQSTNAQECKFLMMIPVYFI